MTPARILAPVELHAAALLEGDTRGGFATARARRRSLRLSLVVLAIRTRFCGALLASFLLGACTLPHYRSAPHVSPPQIFNLEAHDPAIDAIVHTVIVHRGPGAWKFETWWDEYVVTVTNRSDAPLELVTFELEDFTGRASTPGADPWKLERESQRWWQTVEARAAGRSLALGAGATAVGVATYVAGAMGVGSISGAMATTAVAFAAVPVVIVGSVFVNRNQKQKIEAEFQRRRLVLPRVLASRETARGSLFFRVSPGPQRLIVRFREGAGEKSIAVSLQPLADLHFLRREPPRNDATAPPSHR